MTRSQGITPGTCEGHSCLKWETTGELSAVDHKRIMEMLCVVDPLNCPDNSCSLTGGHPHQRPLQQWESV